MLDPRAKVKDVQGGHLLCRLMTQFPFVSKRILSFSSLSSPSPYSVQTLPIASVVLVSRQLSLKGLGTLVWGHTESLSYSRCSPTCRPSSYLFKPWEGLTHSALGNLHANPQSGNFTYRTEQLHIHAHFQTHTTHTQTLHISLVKLADFLFPIDTY